MNKIKKNNVFSFPGKISDSEREVEAIVFAAAEPLSIETISDSGLLLLMPLMFIGASPWGTGGGIKTTTLAALMAATRSTLRHGAWTRTWPP